MSREGYPSQQAQKSRDIGLASGWKQVWILAFKIIIHLLIRLLSEEDIERPELEGWLRASSEKEASGQPASLSSVNLQKITRLFDNMFCVR